MPHESMICNVNFLNESYLLGKLLREVEPELMEALIEATKDGDHSRLRALSVSNAWVGKDDDDEGDEDFEEEHEEEEEVHGV